MSENLLPTEKKDIAQESNSTHNSQTTDILTKNPRARTLKTIPQTIQYLLSIGIGAKFDEQQGGWLIPGFYKANGILIKYEDPKKPDAGMAFPMIKRAQGQPVLNFDDLVELNYAWWCISRKESLAYEMPDECWKDEFHSLGMVERRMQFLPKAKTFNPL